LNFFFKIYPKSAKLTALVQVDTQVQGSFMRRIQVLLCCPLCKVSQTQIVDVSRTWALRDLQRATFI